MKSNINKTMMVYTYLFLFLFIFSGLFKMVGQDMPWDIPADAKAKTSPFLFTDSVKKAGEVIYLANCKSCHGDPGKGNHANLVPIPKDPVTPEYQAHSDGEMFYILGIGRGLMPSFQTTLTEEQRWQVISFVRSFNKDYVQPAIQKISDGEIVSTIKMSLLYDEKYQTMVALLMDGANNKNLPVTNVPVKLFVKRTFGNMVIGQASTDAEGKARIRFPEGLPGDTAGNLSLIAIAGAGGKQIILEKTEKIGIAVKPLLLLDQRSWWNVRSKSPLWLVIAYVCGGIAVGAVVLYVFLQLKKIKSINQLNNTGHA